MTHETFLSTRFASVISATTSLNSRFSERSPSLHRWWLRERCRQRVASCRLRESPCSIGNRDWPRCLHDDTTRSHSAHSEGPRGRCGPSLPGRTSCACGDGSPALRLQRIASVLCSSRDSPRGPKPHKVSLRLGRPKVRKLLTGYTVAQYLKNMPIVFAITIPVSTLNDCAVERPSIRAGNRICTWLSQRTAGAA